ncbi:hypothetical protein [Arthrobacter sp. NPDC090010]|uniref:hypothetical protein n=1 Tax=Arthrobacter sp. NPDC090010 TaxID=3363942 RepID=UPI003824C1AE
MRTTIAVLAAILSFILTLIAGPVVWLERNVVDRAGFVQTLSPLGQDESFKQDLASAIGRRVATEITVPESLQPLITRTVTAAANGMFELPGYPAAWNETLDRSHELSIGDGAKNSTSAFTLDVAPLVDLVAQEASKNLPVKVSGPKVAVISLGNLSQRQMIDPVLQMAPYGIPLAAGAGIAFLLALVSARRRGAFLMVMGIGAVIIAALWKVASLIGVGILGQRLNGELEGLVVARMGEVINSHVDQAFWVMLPAGLVLLVFGVVLESMRRRREIRAADGARPEPEEWRDGDGMVPGL